MCLLLYGLWAVARRAGPRPRRERGGPCGQMSRIDAQIPSTISLFFRPAAGLWPPPDRSRRPSSPTHLSCGQPLRPGRPLDECRNRRKKTPRWQGVASYHLAGHYLAQCPKRPTRIETLFQSARTFWNTVDFRATLLAANLLFSGRFLAAMSFSGAIFGTMSFVCDYIRHNFSFETRFRRALAPRLKNCAGPSRRQTAHRR